VPRLRSKAAALFVASAAALLTAACGGNAGAPATGGGAGGSTAFTAYLECLNKNGVTITMPSGGVRNRPSDGASRFPGGYPSGMPRPSGSAGRRGGGFPGGGGFFSKPAGVDDATWQKAQEACASVRPSGRPGGFGNGSGGPGRNAAFQNCMKEHGVTSTENLSTTDPAVKKALATCRVLRQPAPSATPTT
jgi:hypothetical protein